MRIIYTMLLLSVSFSSISQTPAQTGATDSSFRFKAVCLPVKSVNDVLYVIDGIPVDESALRNLNPSLIDSIFIFKDSASRIFSCRPLRPVIVIHTHRLKNLPITIRDKEGRFTLPGATNSFISSDKRDTLMYVADSSGQVKRKQLKKDVVYDISVTATGYKAFTAPVRSIRNGIIELEREFIMGPEVMLTSGFVYRCGRGCGGTLQRISQECYVQKKLICEKGSEVTVEQAGNHRLNIYPNPVRKGQQVSVKILQGYFPSGSLRVISIDGKQLLSVPVYGNQQLGLVQVSLQQSWTPGVYIFQLVYANGRVGASEKVIIQ